MNNDKAKAEILDWCSQRVECLARRKVLDLVGTLDAAQTSPETESVRDAFEAWATSDNRAIQPIQFEERTDANNHYYESDHDNNAFIGWKAAGHAPTAQHWQPVETAPRDGTRILLFQSGRGAFEGWWHTDWPRAEAYWMDDADSEPCPSHWQPCLAFPTVFSPAVSSTDRNGK